MEFSEKKKQIKNDIYPFLIAIPTFIWLDAEFCLGIPLSLIVFVPVTGYVTLVILELIGFYFWDI